jgi:beta-carotene hydroxylase
MSAAVKPLTVPKELLGPQGGFNLNVLMFFSAIILATGATFGYWSWNWPHWCCFVANVMALHLVGTVIHDASHNVAHANRVINAILGHVSALMLGFSFPVFTRVHMQHHANVNDPDNDPDHYVSTGGPLWLIPVRFFYHEVFFFKRRLWRKFELLEWFLGRAAVTGIVFLAWKYDFLGFIFNYWFSAAGIVGLMLGLFFDYLPHRPHHERDRWKNARIYPSPVMNVLIMGQNYHLIHHLWPSIPWYGYQSAYYATRPLLTEKGCDLSLGLFEWRSFYSFLYDAFVGIRINHRHPFDPALQTPPDIAKTASERQPTSLPAPTGELPQSGSAAQEAVKPGC